MTALHTSTARDAATTTSTPKTVHGKATKEQRKRARGRYFGLRLTLAVVITLVMVFPLLWMIITAFSPQGDLYSPGFRLWPRHVTLNNFTRPFHRFPVWTWFRNSTVITFAVTAITVASNLLAGYAFAKMHFRGRTVLFLVLLSTMMIPVQAIIVSQFKLSVQLGLYGNVWSVILPESATAFGVFLARQFFLSIPDELLDAARVDGAGHLRTLWSVVLPLSKPLIAVLVLLTAMSEWDAFAWPLVALSGDDHAFTVQLGIVADLQSEYSSDYGAIMAISLLSILPIVILFIAFQRYFVQGLSRSGLR